MGKVQMINIPPIWFHLPLFSTMAPMGGEFYMRPQVSSRVTSFEMHAHRANPVDFGANIVLALSTTSGKRVINKTVGTNQYVSYTRSSSDGTGTWDAR